MEMRHQPGFIGYSGEQVGIDFNLINRRKSQTRQIWHVPQYITNQAAERPAARQVRAIGRHVDAGQNDFCITLRGEAANLIDNLASRN